MDSRFALVAYVSGKRVTLDTSKKNPQVPAGASKFYVRYTDGDGKRHDERLGDKFTYALAEVRRLEAARDYERKTGDKFPTTKPEVNTSDLGVAIQDWLKRKAVTPDIAKSTIEMYKYGVTKFQAFAKGRIKNVQDITAQDLFEFVADLKSEQGLGKRSAANCFRYVIIFLKAQGIHLGIPAKYYSDESPREPQEYKPRELKALLAAATPEERLLFDSFYWTGMRNKELANLTYGDINFELSTWRVRPKDSPTHTWRVKSKAGRRWIPVPPTHTKLIEERMIRLHRSEDDLVFPDELGRVHQYYLPILKELSKRAAVRGRVDIHKFRSSCATRWLREGVNVMEVRRRLGHGDLKSIQAYVAMVEEESKETMQQSDQSYREREKSFQTGTESVIPFRAAGD